MYGFGGLDPSERKSQVSAQLDREEESLKALEERMQTSAELTSGMKGQKSFFLISLLALLKRFTMLVPPTDFRDPELFRVPSVSFGEDNPASLSGDGGPSAAPGQHRPDPEVPGPRDRLLQCFQGGGGGGQDRALRGSATPASGLYRSRQWGRLTVPTRTGKVPPFYVKVLN